MNTQGIAIDVDSFGGLNHRQKLVLNRGHVTKINGSNASGKTSLIKAILLGLSAPRDGKFKHNNITDNLGLTKSGKIDFETIVNNESENAEIKIEEGEKKWILSIDKLISEIKGTSSHAEKMVVAGILSRNSQALVQLDEGTASFNWLIEELSLAKYLEIGRSVTNQIREQIEIEAERVEKWVINLEKNKREMAKLEEDSDNLKNELKQKQKAIKRIKYDPSVEKEINKLVKKIKSAETTQSKHEKILEKMNLSIQNREREIHDLNEKIKTNDQQMKNLDDTRKRLTEKNLEQKLKEMLNDWSEKSKDRENNLKTLGRLSAKIEMKKKAQNSADSGFPQCPLCGSETFSYQNLKDEIDINRKEHASLSNQLASEREEFERKKRKIEEENTKLKQVIPSLIILEDKIKNLHSSVNSLKVKTRNDLKIAEPIEQGIIEVQINLKKLRKQHDELVATNKEGSIIQNEIKIIESQISKNTGRNEKLSESTEEFIDILGIPIPIEKATSKIQQLINSLDKLDNLLIRDAQLQKTAVISDFNANTREYTELLGFPRLKGMELDSKFDLILPQLPKNANIASLAVSEKISIALTLLLSAKTIYLKNVPLFLVDDIYNDLDADKQEKFISYLSNLAAKLDISIVITALDPNVEGLKIVEV